MDGGTLAEIEHPVLDAAGVRRLCHLAAERVQFAHQMSLARPADRGVAGHVAHRVEVDGEDDGAQTEPRGGQSRLDARVARADDGDLIFSCEISHDDQFLTIDL